MFESSRTSWLAGLSASIDDGRGRFCPNGQELTANTGVVVITTIAAPTPAVEAFASLPNVELIVVGDRKTPSDWSCRGARFVSYPEQDELGFRLSALLLPDHYSRKNLGYLLAMREGAKVIIESDDDNEPLSHFAASPSEVVDCLEVRSDSRWINVYRFFTEERVWPRGFPLELVQESFATRVHTATATRRAPIQQFLAAGDPDVDAVYRLAVGNADHAFRPGTVAISRPNYVPFNSQSTQWFPHAYPLMYLPVHVSFRMTDIWRAFVAQACLHALGVSLAYHGAGVVQRRNEHDLLRDLEQELPGYRCNAAIVETLAKLELEPGEEKVPRNMRSAYEALVSNGWVPVEEMTLLDAWLDDVAEITESVQP